MRRGLSQENVADQSGVSMVTIGRLDRDSGYRPKSQTMQKPAGGLGMRVGELFDLDAPGEN